MAAVDGEVSRAEADGSGRHDVGERRGEVLKLAEVVVDGFVATDAGAELLAQMESPHDLIVEEVVMEPRPDQVRRGLRRCDNVEELPLDSGQKPWHGRVVHVAPVGISEPGVRPLLDVVLAWSWARRKLMTLRQRLKLTAPRSTLNWM